MVNKGLTCSRCRQHGHLVKDCHNSVPDWVIATVPQSQATVTLHPTFPFSPQARPSFEMPHCDVTFGFGSFKKGFVAPGGTASFRKGAYCFQSGAFAEGAIEPGSTLIFEGGKYAFKESFLALGALGPGSTLYFDSNDIYFHRGAFGADDFSKGNCNLIFHNIDQHTALAAFRNGEAPAAVSVFFPTRDTDFPVDRFPALKPRLNNHRPSAGILQKRKAESPDSIRTKASLREAAEQSRVARRERGTGPTSTGAPPTGPRRRSRVITANDQSKSSSEREALLRKITPLSLQTFAPTAGKPRDDLYRPSSSSTAMVLPSADYYRPRNSSDIIQSSPPRARPTRDLPSPSTTRSPIEEGEIHQFGVRAGDGPIDEDINVLFVKRELSCDD